MKIGILGGSFNPPHIGHMILAEFVKEYLNLDKIIFVPCNIPPHKRKSEIVSGKHRLKMLELALKGRKDYLVSDVELKRGGISYTVDTLKILKKRYPKDKLFLIIGSDLYQDFSTWYKPEEIRKLVKLVVVVRALLKRKERNVIFLKMPKIEISSSLIRERLRKGLSIRWFVPEEVRKYILRNRLYVN